MHSNFYTYRYAAILVIVVAAVLATAAELLKPMQQNNIRIEKMQDILRAAKIEAPKADIIDIYSKSVKMEVAIDTEGNVLSLYKDGKLEKGDIRPFEINLKAELNKISSGKGKAHLPLYVCQSNNETIYIIPVLGKGLWGPIWGNIALAADKNTIKGATFDHKAETPGLGAEISTAEFYEQFINKKIFNTSGEFMSVTVVKGGVEGSRIPIAHGVDAISGGTITCDGVTKMLNDCLKNYVPYLKKQ